MMEMKGTHVVKGGYDIRHLVHHQLGIAKHEAGEVFYDPQEVEVWGKWTTYVKSSDMFPETIEVISGLAPGVTVEILNRNGDALGTVTVPNANCVNFGKEVWKESQEREGRF